MLSLSGLLPFPTLLPWPSVSFRPKEGGRRGGEKLICRRSRSFMWPIFPHLGNSRKHIRFGFCGHFHFGDSPSVCSLDGGQALALAGHGHPSLNSQADVPPWSFES